MFDLSDFPSRAHLRWLRRYWLALLVQVACGVALFWAVISIILLAWGG